MGKHLIRRLCNLKVEESEREDTSRTLFSLIQEENRLEGVGVSCGVSLQSFSTFQPSFVRVFCPCLMAAPHRMDHIIHN